MNRAEAVYRIITEGIYPNIAHKFDAKPEFDPSRALAVYAGLDCVLCSFPKIADAVAAQDKDSLIEYFKTIREPGLIWAKPPSPIVKAMIQSAPLFSPELFEVDPETEALIWKQLDAIIKLLQ